MEVIISENDKRKGRGVILMLSLKLFFANYIYNTFSLGRFRTCPSRCKRMAMTI